MKVFIQITADIDMDNLNCNCPTPAQLRAAAVEAINNAILHSQGEGHDHSLSDHEAGVSIMVDPDDTRIIDPAG